MTAIDAPTIRETPPDSGRSIPAELPALSIERLSHSYGPRRALIDVSFAVAPASFTALLGLNGAGKSTLFSLITRLFGIQSGRIGIFGHDIGQAPGEALRSLGVVFQLLCLLFAVYHSVTWFAVTPKAMPLSLGGERVADKTIVGVHYAAWGLVSLIVLVAAGI